MVTVSSAGLATVISGCSVQAAPAGLAATIASVKPGPFQEFYAALVAKGMRPEMARLTLARKMATIVWIVWKRGVSFDAQYLKSQTA